METPVILSAVRTPVGKFQGGLASFSAPELGGKVVAEVARRAGIDAKQIDEAILGNVVQAGLGQNPARQAALKGGCDPRVAALTINKDRKSTRLNSSHVAISYAVFCLKKKTKT